MNYLSILGSTGSIGLNALKVVEMFPERFSVKALTAKKNIGILAEQIKTFCPEIAVVFDETNARDLKNMLPDSAKVKILYGEDGYIAAATHTSVHTVISAMVGAAGLVPTLAAVDAKKRVALANKETLVMAGEIVMQRAEKNGVTIFPIDSEHNAIFQCLAGQQLEDLAKIHLTASGGPFLNRPITNFSTIKPEDALNHPKWQMGKKISIDSATLMNKGLEVIEAKHFFGCTHDNIEVLIHPQSVVHSMVSFRDGSVIAQLGIPDMLGAVAYAMSHPKRLPLNQPIPDFTGIEALTFEQPDLKKFPCLALAYEACETGRTLPAVMNAANEVAVEAFLKARLSFDTIPVIIRDVMDKHTIVSDPDLEDIKNIDKWARRQAEERIKELG